MINILRLLKKWLKKPFIYREEVDFKILISFILGISVFLVLYLLKPFGLHVVENNLFYYFAGYGVITTFVLLLLYFVINPIFPEYYSNKTWNVKKELFLLLHVFFVAGSISWFYHKKVAITSVDSDKFTYLFFLKCTASIGIFPTIIYVYLSEIFLTKNQKNKTKKLKEIISLKKFNDSKQLNTVTIQSSNKTNSIVLNINNLVYVNSEGNYASFFIDENKENKKLQEQILRIQLHVVEKELIKYKQFIRCHKSYIVNTNYINDITGNARGLTIYLSNSDKLIPVSRKLKKKQLMSLIS